MSLTSISFIGVFLLSVIIYYICPAKFGYIVLLIFSGAFLFASSDVKSIIFVLVNILSTWFFANAVSKANENNNELLSSKLTTTGIAINLILLILVKYTALELAAPLGISFYTVTSIGYLLDCKWDICKAEKNILKSALFIIYWPQMTSGPITRYTQVKDELLSGDIKAFNFEMLSSGLQRMLWGFFKKLVIASKAAVYVDTVYSNAEIYSGKYIWLGSALFMVELYADFSGCMDIILGASEIYGINLPENFRTPFFSVTVQEYWQRWHATLGSWLKDYVFYPIMRTRLFSKFTKALKNKFGKKAARQIPSYAASLIVWLLIGAWHGSSLNYILGMGLWFWGCITINQILRPVYDRILNKLNIDPKSLVWHILMSVKVFIFSCIGNMFFRLNSLENSLKVIALAFTGGPSSYSLESLGLDMYSILLITLFVVAMFVVGTIEEKHGSFRVWLKTKPLVIRWTVWIALLLFTVIFGSYGPGYSASEFIYRGF